MHEFNEIIGNRVILRQLYEQDICDLLEIRGSEQVAKFQFWEAFSKSDAIEFVHENKRSLPKENEWFQLGIVEKQSGKMIGDCACYIDSFKNGTAEIGFNLNSNYWGQGYAIEGILLFIDMLFSSFDIHRIFGTTDCENKGCINLFSKLGFRKEAHFIENVYYKEKWGSEYVFALLKSEYEHKKARL